MTKNASCSAKATPPLAIRCRQLECYSALHGTFVPLHRYDATSVRNGTIRKDGKRPIHRDWTKRPYSSAKVLKWCLENNHNVGLRLPGDVVVIDIDPRNNGNKGWDNLCLEYGIDESMFPCVITGSGGRHYYARKPADVPVLDTLKDFDGVEFKSKGRQVVASGSIHPETLMHYVWDDNAPAPEDMPELPEVLLLAITRPQQSEITSGGQWDQHQLAAVLARLKPEDFRQHDRWIKLMMGLRRRDRPPLGFAAHRERRRAVNWYRHVAPLPFRSQRAGRAPAGPKSRSRRL
jgi:hypothetical protein